MATVKLGKDNPEEVISAKDIILADFWAGWCGPCRFFAPVFGAASDRYPGVVFAKVDTETEPQLAAEFGIMSIPTLMVFRDQVLLYAQPGALPAQALDQLIARAKELDMDEVRRQLAEQVPEAVSAQR